MSRRPDPALLEEARRRALRNRLIGDGLLPEQADSWVQSWRLTSREAPAGSGYWEAAYRWIRAKVDEGARP